MRVLPEQKVRVETGPIKFGDDWTGVFIRGDNAFNYAITIKGLLNSKNIDPICQMELEGLLEILSSCDEKEQRTIHAN